MRVGQQAICQGEPQEVVNGRDSSESMWFVYIGGPVVVSFCRPVKPKPSMRGNIALTIRFWARDKDQNPKC